MTTADKRRHPRKEVFTAALIALDGEGHLSEVWDLSQGGARLGRPLTWTESPGPVVRIYFMLDQETVIAVDAKVVRVSDDHLGIEFGAGQDERVQSLLYEARFLEPSS